ncbi:MAG: hypothetical protein ACREMV_15595 [Gemmatimonadales bacterium]
MSLLGVFPRRILLLMIALRLVHVVLGVFWAGTLIFVATFLNPAVRAAGPEGGRVMLRLQERGFMTVMPVVAALTILSGLALYWRISGGLQGVWVGSRMGIAFAAGGVASIVAFVIGVFVMRPAALRVAVLVAGLEQVAEGPARQARQAEIQALRLRNAAATRWVAGLLGIAVVTMAVARYV